MDRLKSSLNCREYNKKLSDTVCKETTITYSKFKKEHLQDTKFRTNGLCHSSTSANESIRAGSSQSKFCFSNVRNTKERRYIASNFQFKKSEQVHPDIQISSNQCTKSAEFFTTKRLHDHNRFTKCILPFASKQIAQTLSTCYIQKPVDAVDMFAFRSCLRSKNFCLLNKLDRPIFENNRSTNSCISRRFFISPSKPSNALFTRPKSHSVLRETRMENKLQKIDPYPTKKHSILGNYLESPREPEISAGTEMQAVIEKTPQIAKTSKGNIKRNAKLDRVLEFCQFPGSQRSSESSNAFKALQCVTAAKSPLLLSNPSRWNTRIGLVDCEFNKPFSDTLPTSNELSRNRCIRDGMGSKIESCKPLRSMVFRRSSLPLQQEGDVSNLVRLKRSRSCPKEFDSFSSERQQNGHSLFKERGRNEIRCFNESLSKNIQNFRLREDTHRVSLHPRSLQQRSRSPLAQSSASRVASPARNNRENFCFMGNTDNRFICFSPGSRSTEILQSRHKGSKSTFLRRVQSNLELSTCMGVSAPLLDTQGSSAHELSQGNIFDRGTTVGEGILETGSQKQGNKSSLHNTQSRQSPYRCNDQTSPTQMARDDSRSLEMWGWSDSLKDWSKEQRLFLQKAWRSSTLRTYKNAWQKWSNWANKNSVTVSKPSGSDLAKFLIDLHQIQGLAYNTILVYKSAVATLCDPNCHDRLSSHLLVHQALKSIKLNTCNNRPKTTPIWDVDDLIKWLKENVPDSNSFYECSARAALLLLLYSGRRVHDLTLLTIEKEGCLINEGYIILWPRFGSKTDSVRNWQSGWRILENKECNTLDAVYWIKRMIELSHDRRSKYGLNNLFITTCGLPRPASRTYIAGWVKRIFIQAGINASPGSIRSAVNSKNFIQNCPIDEILSKGNWRSERTFMKYYCREVRSKQTGQSMSQYFEPVNEN